MCTGIKDVLAKIMESWVQRPVRVPLLAMGEYTSQDPEAGANSYVRVRLPGRTVCLDPLTGIDAVRAALELLITLVSGVFTPYQILLPRLYQFLSGRFR